MGHTLQLKRELHNKVLNGKIRIGGNKKGECGLNKL